MAYEHHRTVRFEDVDFARLVYFPRLFAYCHQAFEDFFGAELGTPYSLMLQERKVGFPTVHAEADFKAPLRFGDRVKVVLETLEVGNRSLHCRYRLFDLSRAQLCAELRLVVASIDMDALRAIELPADVRKAFSRHLVTG